MDSRIFSCTDKKDIPVVAPVTHSIDKNWVFETTPMWEDNFNSGTVPDVSKWSYDIGGSGWGNNECNIIPIQVMQQLLVANLP
jgi:hypothetical protein